MNYENLISESKSLLNSELGYNATDSGLTAVFEEWGKQKKPLLELFRKHPNWNEEKLRIEIDTDFFRGIDSSAVKSFIVWARSETVKIFQEQYKVQRGYFSYKEIKDIVDKLYDKIEALENYHIMGLPLISELRTGMRKEREHYQELLEQMRVDTGEPVEEFGNTYIPHSQYNKFYRIDDIFDYVKYDLLQFLKDADVKKLNQKLEEAGIDLEAKSGQKTSRFVNALCKKIGLHKITNMVKKEWDSDDGTHHEREVDEGYNKQFAAFADAINPLKVSEKVYISLNPIDYWTMSFGNGWSSCYCIDKNNVRDLSNTYDGDYCAGTTSYMLDPTSFIVFTDGDWDRYGKYTKKRRCVFAWGEDKLFQSRVYPDGRDGGDRSYATQLREVMQKTFAELLDVPNLWLKKSVSSSYYDWEGCGYNDFANAGECNISFLKLNEDGEINENSISIAATPICISTGDTYHDSSTIDTTFDGGGYDYYCERCNTGFNEDEYDAVWTEGGAYCCSYCAEEDGWHWMDNYDEWMHENDDDVYLLENGEWYYDRYGEVITTSDGCHYADNNEAIDAGYRYCEDTEEWEDEYYSTEEGEFYHDYDEMINAGYCEPEDDEGCYHYKHNCCRDDFHDCYLVDIDDLLEVRYEDEDGNETLFAYFVDIEEAIGDGFIENENQLVKNETLGFWEVVKQEESEVA